MSIDRQKLRADLCALSRECRALGDVLGRAWTRPMADEQRRLVRLRWRVTELCVLAASSRGKMHAKKVRNVEDIAAWHARILERVSKDYPSPEPVAADIATATSDDGARR